MNIEKTAYRFFATAWKMLRGLGILVLFLLIIRFPFVITDNWIYRSIIIIGGFSLLIIISFLTRDKKEERYFLIISLRISEVIPLFTAWINKEGFSVTDKFNKADLKWLKTQTRNQCKVYNFYNLLGKYTVMSENILQDELKKKIDVFFSDEVKSISENFDVPIYYIAEEHSLDWYEVFHKGKQDKILSFYTHVAGPVIEQFKEQGVNVSKEEIKRRDYFSDEDFIKGLGFPVEIEKKSIRKIIKSSLYTERLVFCKL